MSDLGPMRGDTATVHGPIPVVVYEAAVQAAGSALHWRSTLFTILRTAGMKQHVIDSYQTSGLSKFQIARDALDRFGSAGPNGWKAQRRLVAELANLEKPDPKAPDPAAGVEALRALRRVAVEAKLLVSSDELERRRRQATSQAEAEQRSRRSIALTQLHGEFQELSRLEDRQKRGYGLERILSGLFGLDELPYEVSYKTQTEQIDGTVTVDSFLYIVEARWREAPAVADDLAGLLSRATDRLEATRGLFVSMAGFRAEVVQRYRMRPGKQADSHGWHGSCARARGSDLDW